MILASRGPVAENADGSVGMMITIAPEHASAFWAWLASTQMGAQFELGAPMGAVPVPPQLPVAPEPQMPATPARPPTQSIGMDGDGIAATQSGTGPRLSPDDQAVIEYARSLARLPPFQVWVELQCRRDASCDSTDHAGGWLLMTAGARSLPDLLTPGGRSKLRAITASYAAWYAQSHPPGRSALDGVAPCALVNA